MWTSHSYNQRWLVYSQSYLNTHGYSQRWLACRHELSILIIKLVRSQALMIFTGVNIYSYYLMISTNLVERVHKAHTHPKKTWYFSCFSQKLISDFWLSPGRTLIFWVSQNINSFKESTQNLVQGISFLNDLFKSHSRFTHNLYLFPNTLGFLWHKDVIEFLLFSFNTPKTTLG